MDCPRNKIKAFACFWGADMSVRFACVIVSVYASLVGLLKVVNVGCAVKCRKLAVRGPQRAFDEISRNQVRKSVSRLMFLNPVGQNPP